MSLLCPRKLPNLTFVRFARHERNKLKKPEDKSLVILGKTKKSKPYIPYGISEKSVPIHVKWERPMMIETCNAQISGDIGGLEHFGKVDMSQPPVKLEKSKALQTATEDVKRVLSLEFSRRRDVMDKLTQEVLKSVQRHPRDFDSLEVKITIATIKIRNLQHELIQLYPYKNQPVKHVLTHKISYRRSLLRDLREKDYKKYEWLLEKLNVIYKPMPQDGPKGVLIPRENVERKASIERLTDLWCDELKRHRLHAFQRKLEADQVAFLIKKAEKMRNILKEEKELNLEQTVTEEQIELCLKKAEDIKAKHSSTDYNKAEEYLIYKEEIQQADHSYLNAA